MHTQCPECKKEQDIPKEYEGRNIKCSFCKSIFVAKQFIPAPVEVELPAHRAPSEPSPIKCPICGSNQIMGGRKGFSGGKALAGALALGPIGALAGLHGSKRIVITCLQCGHEWKPGG